MEEEDHMFSKLLAIVQTKVGAAVVATVLVAGGGTAVAVTATHGSQPTIGSHLSASASPTEHSATAQDEQGNANHLSVEGTLASYTPASGSTPGSISVQADSQSSDAEAQSTQTEVKSTQTEGTSSDSQSEGKSSGSQSTGKSPVSIKVTSATKINGEHASSLADLSAAVGHKVQVQATKQSGAWVADKVTVEGSSTGKSDGSGEQSDTEVDGSVLSVDAAAHSFVVRTQHGPVTVTVSSTTRFSGGLSGLAALKTGDSVQVQGAKQSDGSVAATQIEASGHASGEPTETTGSGDHPVGTPSPIGTPQE